MGLVSNTGREVSLYLSRTCIVIRNCGLLKVASLPGIIGILMAAGRKGVVIDGCFCVADLCGVVV